MIVICNSEEVVVVSKGEVMRAVTQCLETYLDNCTGSTEGPLLWKDCNKMGTKINRTFAIDGKQVWIRAKTEQEYADKVGKLYRQGMAAAEPPADKHSFVEYAYNWFDVYASPNLETTTVTTYRRQISLHLVPAFGEMAVEDISADDVQRFLNGMKGAKATKQKALMVLNQILDSAMEDKIISSNPGKSKRLRIKGERSVSTKEYSVEQMQFLVHNLDKLSMPMDRAYLSLQALHSMRLEEVLGLKWEDINMDGRTIHIQRAVTHPKRNRPEIKDTKTTASDRIIAMSAIAARYLFPGAAEDFVLGGKNPLSYTTVRNMCKRIQRETGFSEKITPIRFRTTTLTDIYNQTGDVKQTQAAAGHASSAMTLDRYAKGRKTARDTADVIDRLYGGESF